jgi:hypothetical protein
MAETTSVPWRIVGEEVASCNCAWGCPCQFNALPTHGRCEAIVGVRIREGHYGATKLDGLTFAQALWFPGAVHEGKGIGRLAVDVTASTEQRAAIAAITMGKAGGMPFEIFAAVTETFLDPMFIPIEFEHDRAARTARLHAPGLAEFQIEPIKNPVTGEPLRALITLPEGFEYKEAEMGNTLSMHAVVGDKTLNNQNCYAQLAAINWTNE